MHPILVLTQVLPDSGIGELRIVIMAHSMCSNLVIVLDKELKLLLRKSGLFKWRLALAVEIHEHSRGNAISWILLPIVLEHPDSGARIYPTIKHPELPLSTVVEREHCGARSAIAAHVLGERAQAVAVLAQMV